MTTAGALELVELESIIDDSTQCKDCENDADWILCCPACRWSGLYCGPCKSNFENKMRRSLPHGGVVIHLCGNQLQLDDWLSCWRPI